MKAYILENAMILARSYARANQCEVVIYEIKNKVHRVLWYEYYPKGASQLKLFDRKPDFAVTSNGKEIEPPANPPPTAGGERRQ